MAEAPKPKPAAPAKPAVSAKAAGPAKLTPGQSTGEKGKKPPNPLIPVIAIALIVVGIGWAVYGIMTAPPEKVEKKGGH